MFKPHLKMTVEQQIRQLFVQHKDLTVLQLTQLTKVSKQLVHRILKKLTAENFIQKFGLPPKTIYRKIELPEATLPENHFNEEENHFLNDNFLLITETGQFLEGYKGFALWCMRRKLPIEKTFLEYQSTKLKYASYYNSNGWIDGTEKIKNTKGYDAIYLDKLFYFDFYAIERFGKTKLGTILHYAKQGQNKWLMEVLLNNIKLKTEQFLAHYQIDAIGFVPPTIRREVQLMKFLQNGLQLNIPLVDIQKISGIIPVPQKSLNKLEERITNADTTFAIYEAQKYKRVLLIDDAVGSGATLNQIAKKLKDKGTAEIVYGLAIVGSFKGFDVITDV